MKIERLHLLQFTAFEDVELSFAGEWPKESRQGAPGPVNAFLTGWIDGDSGGGRMRVEGRSDGSWAAKRKP